MASTTAPNTAMGNEEFHLTPREREILECLARGMTNDEIGRELYLARGTVKAHLCSMYTKMGVSNRTQAAVMTLRPLDQPRPVGCRPVPANPMDRVLGI